jgi:hypothetical protein
MLGFGRAAIVVVAVAVLGCQANKYAKEVNEDPNAEVHVHEHGPDCGHDHGHAEEKHEHDHHEHDHHDHGHHDHDHHDHDHAAVEKQEKHDHDHGHHDHGHAKEHHNHDHDHDDHGHDDHTHHDDGHGSSSGGRAKKTLHVWEKAIASTAFISLAPIVMLWFIPIDADKPESQSFLKVLLAFAAGGLLGDAFLHLLPHAINPHSHADGDHDHAHAHDHSAHGDEGHVGFWFLLCCIDTSLFPHAKLENEPSNSRLNLACFVSNLREGHGRSDFPFRRLQRCCL